MSDSDLARRVELLQRLFVLSLADADADLVLKAAKEAERDGDGVLAERLRRLVEERCTNFLG